MKLFVIIMLLNFSPVFVCISIFHMLILIIGDNENYYFLIDDVPPINL